MESGYITLYVESQKPKPRKKPKPENITEEIREKEAEK